MNTLCKSATVAAILAAPAAAGNIEAGKPMPLSEAQAITVQNGVRKAMKDPKSATFGPMAASRNSRGLVTVCGGVNGKNSLGGYSGMMPFIGVFNDDGKSFAVARIATQSDAESTIEVCRMAGVPI